MPKRSSKRHTLPNQPAAPLVAEAMAAPAPANRGKNPAAVALGRLGGLKGGKARARKLSAKKRSEIARAAARARWGAKTSE